MKRAICIIFILLLIAGINLSVSSLGDTSIPPDVQTTAGNSMKIVKAKMSEKPGLFGFESKWDIEKLTQGHSWQVHFIGINKIGEPTIHHISQLEDESIIPVFIFTLGFEGSIKALFTVGNEGGAEYHLVEFSGYGDYIRVFESTLIQFSQMVQRKGAATETLLYSIAGRYIFIASVGNTEYALPVPVSSEIDFSKIQEWNAERLWTSEEIIQVIKDAKKNYKPGVLGNGISFSKAPIVNMSWPWYSYVIILAGFIPVVVFSIAIL
jgi:hypothetical protein